MADREKVIKALECCYCNFPKQMDCKNCPYDKICYHDKACSLMLRDALALLKESVPQGVVDQIRWERDTALSQLKEIGKGLGEKMDDIVALLKEQEAEDEPTFDDWTAGEYPRE